MATMLLSRRVRGGALIVRSGEAESKAGPSLRCYNIRQMPQEQNESLRGAELLMLPDFSFYTAGTVSVFSRLQLCKW